MFRLSIFSISLLLGLKFAPSYAQAPGGVDAGLTAWYKADAGITLTGTAIATWENQATNPNLTLLTPVGGSTTPVNNNASPFNFNTYLQFDNSGMLKGTSTTQTEVLELDKGSMIGVGTAPDQLVVLTSTFTTSPCGANRCSSGVRFNRTEFGNQGVMFNPNFVLNDNNRANIWGFRASTSGTPQVENTYNGMNATGAAGTRAPGSYRFAIGSFPGYTYAQNRAAEVICYNRQLTSDEFIKIQSYLAIKYGITLGLPTATVDYVSSNGTTIWNGDINYHNNITGIGRDDDSGLLQKQSKSITDGSLVFIYNNNVNGAFPAMNVDNNTTFTSDNSFVVFGDNMADTTLNTCAENGKIIRMNRVWKMQKTGTVNEISIAFDETTLSPNIQSLLVSNDPSFPVGSTNIIPLNNAGGFKYGVMNAANTYFTFGSEALEIEVEVVDVTCQQSSGGSITAQVTGGIPPYTFSWNTNPSLTGNHIEDIAPGNYILTITHGNGCVYEYPVTLSNKTIELQPQLTSTDITCFGDDDGSISAAVLNGTPPYTYSLNSTNNFSSTNSFQNLTKGFYTVHVRDINGCVGSDTVPIHEPARLSLNLDFRDDFCDLGDDPNGYVDIIVRGGTPPYVARLNGSSISDQDATSHINRLSAGHYNYQITDLNGCIIEDTFSIQHVPCCLVFIPNSFTPNGDGVNDYFKAEHAGNVILEKMYIYNRLGQLVFKTSDWNIGWDGTFYGKHADIGLYYYTIEYTCITSGVKSTNFEKGEITLIR